MEKFKEGEDVFALRDGEWVYGVIDEPDESTPGQYSVLFEDGTEATCTADQLRPYKEDEEGDREREDEFEAKVQAENKEKGAASEDIFVTFDEEGSLKLREDAFCKVRDSCVDYFNEIGEEVARSVSFLGSTQAGKSTIINSLLGSTKANVASDTMTSTTCGIQAYPTKFPVGGVTLIDVEGEDGTTPKEDLGSGMTTAARRVAVANHFPRLSYTISDVVVFISRESFANASLVRRTLELATQATRGVEHAEKPHLVIISNMYAF